MGLDRTSGGADEQLRLWSKLILFDTYPLRVFPFKQLLLKCVFFPISFPFFFFFFSFCLPPLFQEGSQNSILENECLRLLVSACIITRLSST